MRKAAITAIIVFMVVLGVGLAFAKTSTPFSFDSTTGTLYFVDSTGTVTPESTQSVTVNGLLPSSTLPSANAKALYYGTLTYTDPVGLTTNTVNFTATLGPNGIYSFTGPTTAAASGTSVMVSGQFKISGKKLTMYGVLSSTTIDSTVSPSTITNTSISFQGVFSESSPK